MRRVSTLVTAAILAEAAVSTPAALARATSPPVPTTWVSVAEPFTLIAAGIGLALAAMMRRPPRR